MRPGRPTTKDPEAMTAGTAGMGPWGPITIAIAIVTAGTRRMALATITTALGAR